MATHELDARRQRDRDRRAQPVAIALRPEDDRVGVERVPDAGRGRRHRRPVGSERLLNGLGEREHDRLLGPDYGSGRRFGYRGGRRAGREPADSRRMRALPRPRRAGYEHRASGSLHRDADAQPRRREHVPRDLGGLADREHTHRARERDGQRPACLDRDEL